MDLLCWIASHNVFPAEFNNNLFRVVGFYEYLQPDVGRMMGKVRKEKEKEMKEY